MKRLVNLLPILFLVLLVLIGIFAIYKIKSEKDFGLKLAIGEEVELPEFSFKSLYKNKSNITNYDFIGHKYSVLNLFASWCTTCLAEHGVLLELSKNKNVKLYGIAFQDIDNNTKKFLKDHNNPYLKVGVDNKGDLSKILAVNGVPETFIVNGDGKIIYRHQGNLTSDILKLFK